MSYPVQFYIQRRLSLKSIESKYKLHSINGYACMLYAFVVRCMLHHTVKYPILILLFWPYHDLRIDKKYTYTFYDLIHFLLFR